MNAVCFYSSKERLSQTLYAIESFYQHNPKSISCYLLYCELPGTPIPPIPSHVNIINYDHPDILEHDRLYKLYGAAARPIIAQAVMNLGYEKILCLDGDMEVFDSLADVYKMLNLSHAVVTPHITAPLPVDGKIPSMENIRLAGNYNAGFFAFRSSPEMKNFINWWVDMSCKKGLLQPNFGLFAEQGWLQFLADFVDNVKILRTTGYNTAYWNIGIAQLKLKDGTWITKDGPLKIFHYSGLQFHNLENISRYQNRYFASGDTLQLLERYRDNLKLRGAI